MVRSNLSSRTVALVLAGGQGSRLAPLTDSKPKPAASLAGTYTLIDIVLSNLSHSGIRNVWIIEQYLGHVLNSYLSSGRPWDLDGTRSGLRIAPPVEGRDQDDSEGFSEGNGHVLFQQLEALEESGANTVIVTSADHLYSLDFRAVLEQHHSTNSDLTIVTTAIEEHPGRYGVVEADDAGRVTSYVYKPEDPAGQIVATEVFIFEVEALAATIRRLLKELDSPSDLGDYGETIIPAMVRDGIVNEYRMGGYWRDLGTIDAYFQAHMDIIDGAVALDDPDWPVITNTTHFPPPMCPLRRQ
ncbi:ADP-glucose pyrophosphorylase [Corynebacterium pilosum]|uniref:ADP-glucose pyrophosphorylase n=1 Tax=Corynebacterium pilosum TaxID=35756 RepID=A0A376CMJ4_9CORY|nr:ADP-glucose pyrophosphorylase [Corynebacterium pilosum]